MIDYSPIPLWGWITIHSSMKDYLGLCSRVYGMLVHLGCIWLLINFPKRSIYRHPSIYCVTYRMWLYNCTISCSTWISVFTETPFVGYWHAVCCMHGLLDHGVLMLHTLIHWGPVTPHGFRFAKSFISRYLLATCICGSFQWLDNESVGRVSGNKCIPHSSTCLATKKD